MASCAAASAVPCALPRRLKIAVVGSGIAGLTAAYLLGEVADVTLFEREGSIGMDAQSVDACCCGECPKGTTCARLVSIGKLRNVKYAHKACVLPQH